MQAATEHLHNMNTDAIMRTSKPKCSVASATPCTQRCCAGGTAIFVGLQTQQHEASNGADFRLSCLPAHKDSRQSFRADKVTGEILGPSTESADEYVGMQEDTGSDECSMKQLLSCMSCLNSFGRLVERAGRYKR